MPDFPKEFIRDKWGRLLFILARPDLDTFSLQVQAYGVAGETALARDAKSLREAAGWLESNQWILCNVISICVGPITDVLEMEWLRKTFTEVASELRAMETESAQQPSKKILQHPGARTA